MRKIRISTLIWLCCLFLAGVSHAAELGADLETVLNETGPGELVPVIVELADRVDLRAYNRGRDSAGEMIVALRHKAAQTQPALRDFLALQGVVEVKSFWINNSLAFDATPELVNELLAHPAVGTIYHNASERLDPVEVLPAGDRDWGWNLDRIRAEEVWLDLGMTGSGIVIGIIATGVDVDHPALAGKWRGGENSWIDYINGLPEPYDDHGGGTNKAGVLMGGDGPGPFDPDIGVAYGAQYIAAKVFDANGQGDFDYRIAAAQWMLDPDGDPGTDDFPHIVNISWTISSNGIYHSSTEALRSAGIIAVCNIGGAGPDPGTTMSPANYNNTIGVGATMANDAVWPNSSRGPSPGGIWYPDDYRKPDLCAPGAAVTSAVPGGEYAVFANVGLAASHVAGTVALMLEADENNPDLDLSWEDIRKIFWQHSVDIDEPGYDYNAGYGRLDAYAAVSAVITDVDLPGDPASFVLSAAPNPFCDQVRIRYAGPQMTDAKLTVYNVSGRRVRELGIPAGGDGWIWDGTGSDDRRLPAGVYLLSLRANGGRYSERVLLLR